MLFDARRALPKANQDVLAAADYIREHGWTQRVRRRLSGEACILGALQRVSESTADAENLLYEKMESGVVIWNDTPGRTKEEVIAKLEEIAWSK